MDLSTIGERRLVGRQAAWRLGFIRGEICYQFFGRFIRRRLSTRWRVDSAGWVAIGLRLERRQIS